MKQAYLRYRMLVYLFGLGFAGLLFGIPVKSAEQTIQKTEQTPDDTLCSAVKKGEIERVRELLLAGADTELKDAQSYTPLIYAAQYGHTAISALLLESNAALETKSNLGSTALMFAAEKGHTPIVELLLAAGADKEAKNKNAFTPLLYAASNGRKEVIEVLLAAHTDIESSDNTGITPLMQAAGMGHKETVELLLKAGADSTAKDTKGRTLLMFAALGGNKEIAVLFLEAGLESVKDVQDTLGYTALFWAADKGHADIVALLIQAKAQIEIRSITHNTPLICAASVGNKEVVALLVQEGANIEAPDGNGHTPLLRAAINGHHEVIALLLAANANIEAQNKFGDTAVKRAASKGHMQAVRLLIQAKANIETSNNEGETPLMRACANGHKEVLQDLLCAHVHIEAKNNKGETALMWAAAQGCTAIVQELLRAGAYIDAKNKKGETALKKAKNFGRIETVQALTVAQLKESKPLLRTDYDRAFAAIRDGDLEQLKMIVENALIAIDIDKVNDEGVTLLAEAIEADNAKIVIYLLSKGANPVITHHKGESPLLIAERKNAHSPITRLLQNRSAKLAKEAEEKAAELCQEEEQERARQEKAKRLQIQQMLSMGAVTRQERDGETILMTDQADSDTYYVAQRIHSFHSLLHAQSKESSSPSLKSEVKVRRPVFDAKRAVYDQRVQRWFDEPEHVIMHDPGYTGVSAALGRDFIFYHNIAGIIDTITAQWGLFDGTGLTLLYGIVIRNDSIEHRIMEYGIDTSEERWRVYHRYFNKMAMHLDIEERFIVPANPPASVRADDARISPTRVHADGSFIVHMTDTYVEIYDPKNEATIFICKPR